MPSSQTRANRLAWMCGVAALAALALLSSAATPAAAQPASDRPLVIGTKEAAPFAIKRPDGTWSGISIDLWTGIATDLGVEYELREMELADLLEAVAAGELDAAVAAITVTPEREAVMDFTHPFHLSGLGVATQAATGSRRWLSVVEQFFSVQFLSIVLGLVALLFVVGWLVWVFERRDNPDQFGGPPAEGLGSGFWWSAVTMTTVGYGDKAPQTVGGRVVALLWMFTALIVISSFTASITASLTVSSLGTSISGVDDLAGVRVVSVADSTSSAYLAAQGYAFTEQPDVAGALDVVAAGQADAVVYDEPILRYEIRRRGGDGLVVLPFTFERQLYAIALPPDSPLREPINRALLDRTASTDWQRILNGYLGDGR